MSGSGRKKDWFASHGLSVDYTDTSPRKLINVLGQRWHYVSDTLSITNRVHGLVRMYVCTMVH